MRFSREAGSEPRSSETYIVPSGLRVPQFLAEMDARQHAGTDLASVSLSGDSEDPIMYSLLLPVLWSFPGIGVLTYSCYTL